MQKNFRRPLFTAEVLPLMRESSLTNLPEQSVVYLLSSTTGLLKYRFQSGSQCAWLRLCPFLGARSIASAHRHVELVVHEEQRPVSIRPPPSPSVLLFSHLVSAVFRLREYRPMALPLLCPDFRCPFLRTVSNSGFCVWKQPQVRTFVFFFCSHSGNDFTTVFGRTESSRLHLTSYCTIW